MTFASAEWRAFCLSLAPFESFSFVLGEREGECGCEFGALGFADDWLLDIADRVADRDKAGDTELASSQSSSWS